MTPIYPNMWQLYPASGSRDLMDYLEIWLLEDLTDEELSRGYEYLDPPLPKLCIKEDCERPIYVREMCMPHYQQWYYRTKKAK